MTSAAFPPGARVVAYFRDSGGKDQDTSVDQQLAEASAYCQKYSLALVRTFADAARSGRRVVGRDQFLEMIDYLTREGHTEAGVLFWNYDRLARDYDDSAYYISLLRRFGLQVHSLTDNIPPGLEGRLFEAILSYKAAKYSEDLSRNVKRGMRHVVAAYKGWPTSRQPVGYVKVPQEIGTRRDGTPHIIYRLQPDPRTGPLVTLAFQMRARLADLRDIHAATGLFATKTGYSSMFRKPIYTGLMVYRGEEFPDFCPPLVDTDTWAAVQKINAAWTKRTGLFSPRGVHSPYLLTGLITCRRCGSLMYGVSVKGKWHYYRCFGENNGLTRCTARQIPKEMAETWVLSHLRERLSDPIWLESIAAQQAAIRSEQESELAARLENVTLRLAAARRVVARIVSAIREIGHSQALIDELRAAEQEASALENEQTNLRRAPEPAENLTTGDILAGLRAHLAALEHGDEQERRRELHGLVAQVSAERVGRQVEGEIVLYLPGSSNV